MLFEVELPDDDLLLPDELDQQMIGDKPDPPCPLALLNVDKFHDFQWSYLSNKNAYLGEKYDIIFIEIEVKEN